MKDKYIILYDGECAFCNNTINWILPRDKNDIFLYAPLQGAYGQDFLQSRGLPTKDFTTIYLFKEGEYYLTESRAIFQILSLLGYPYKLTGLLKHLPEGLTNPVYRKISTKRDQLAKNNCLVPSEKEREKFLA